MSVSDKAVDELVGRVATLKAENQRLQENNEAWRYECNLAHRNRAAAEDALSSAEHEIERLRIILSQRSRA